jgi:hypothetical protein
MNLLGSTTCRILLNNRRYARHGKPIIPKDQGEDSFFIAKSARRDESSKTSSGLFRDMDRKPNQDRAGRDQ